MGLTEGPDLSALFAPGSVAVIGASEREGSSAGYVMKNLARFGYAGRVIPVHPRGGSVFGLPAVTALADLETPPDCAVLGLRADLVPQALEEAGAAGVKAAVILASGFRESGAEGAALETRVAQIAERHRMAVVGPNCLGTVATGTGAALYSSTLSPDLPKGRVALISASGATAIALAHSGQIGLGHVVTAGNAAVTGLADYLSWFARDPGTDVIALVIEGIGDPDALAAAMEQAHAAGKPVVALRVGRSAAGQRATAAHTGALAGSEDAARAFCARVGLIDMPDMDSFLAAVRLCSALPRPPAIKGAAVLGVSGGGVAHAADIASETGLPLADLAAETVQALADLLPGFATAQNPLDVTGAPFADPALYTRILTILSEDPGVGVIVAAQDAPPALTPEMAAEYLGIAGAVAAHDGPKPVVALANLSDGLHGDVARAYGTAPRLKGTRAGLTAVAGWMGTPRALSWRRASGTAPLTMMSEQQARTLMAACHLPSPAEALATSAREAQQIAARIGGPVVLKIASADIAHKTEAGGVALDVHAATAADTFARIMAQAHAYAPEARLDGVLVQEQVSGGIEAVLGLVRHDPYGLGLVVGLGGTLVELLADSAFDLLPVDAERARAMLGRTRLGALLKGYRGAPAGDAEALIRAMVALSDFGCTHAETLDAVDLNPVRVLPQGLRLLDALILPKQNLP